MSVINPLLLCYCFGCTFFFFFSLAYARIQVKLFRRRFTELQKFATVGRATSGLLHDLSNPVTFAKLLAEQQNGENAQLIRQGLQQVSALITSTRQQLSDQPSMRFFYPVTEIRRAMRFSHYALQRRHLVYCLEAETGVRLFGNPCKFYQAASNLLSNAIEAYTGSRSVRAKKGVRIVLKRKGDWVIFQVQDFGRGIPRKYQRHIFHPLFTTKNPSVGTGIGLTGTKEIVEDMFKGNITFSSIEKVGTTFTIRIPLPCNPS
jgi:signal transduction histidine kinase